MPVFGWKRIGVPAVELSHHAAQWGELLALAILVLAFTAGENRGQSIYEPYTFSTVAGLIGGPGEADGTGPSARFKLPLGLAADAADNLYVADTQNHTIRMVSPAGVVTTLAGLAHTPGAADGPASGARFNLPQGIAADRVGNLYVADTGNHIIRKVAPGGTTSTLAGLAGERGCADGTGSDARFDRPSAVAVDTAGNVYVSDTGNSTIRKITLTGVVSTMAGMAGSEGRTDGVGSEARFIEPEGLAVDGAGVVFVAASYTIRKITPEGIVTTFAGRSVPGSVDGTGTQALFMGPVGLVFSPDDDLYVSDGAIRKVTPEAVVSTIAGNPYLPGSVDGTGPDALFNWTAGVAVNSAGEIFTADVNNCTIRKITPAGVVSTFAGLPAITGSTDGTGSEARFGGLSSVAVDQAGNVYVSDAGNCVIRKMTAAGVVTTFAGEAVQVGGYRDGPAESARFNGPSGMAVDRSGTVYVADFGNHLVRKVTPDGVVSTLAGKYVFDLNRQAPVGGFNDGPGAEARFNGPFGMAVDQEGNIFVGEVYNNDIRKITPAGVVTSFAGSRVAGSADGTGAAAGFNQPEGVALDQLGNLYVADQLNNTIRKITPAGVVTTLAGLAGKWGSADGIGQAARFSWPVAVAVDSAGNLYVADSSNHLIRKVTPGGVVTTLAGLAGIFGGADGTGSSAQFNYPHGVAMDDAGNLFVTDGNAIRRGAPALAIRSFGSEFGFHRQFGFVVAGPAGRVAIVQTSTDLQNWLPLSTNTLTAEGWLFRDAQSHDPHRCYRALLPVP
jgi:sugar lactone lactonase YvrE